MTPARGTALLAALALAGCSLFLPKKPAVAPQSGLSLTRVAFADLPGWDAATLDDALAAFRRGCALLVKKPAATSMGGVGYAGTVGDWLSICAQAGGDARVFFETRFTPFAIGAGDEREDLFTGYYEPEILAAPVRGGVYQTPIYALPSDLIQADLSAFDPKLAGQRLAGRLDGQRLVPYATRAEIDTRGLPKAVVLLYAADPVTLFFLQIQGSGRARLPDGRVARLTYAGANGQPYTAIGRTLIAQGALKREDVSLQSIRAWLAAHPDQARSVMESDKSYVFFQQSALGDASLGAIGTMGAALTPEASLAIDAQLNALGAPYFVAAARGEGSSDSVQRLLIGQDTGGAIRGAVRGDIFFGFGSDAENRAGHMNAAGLMFVLLPNALATKIGASRDFGP